MTGNKLLLDTNILIAFLKGENGIINYLDDAADVFIPAIVLGELYYGAYNSHQIHRNIQDIQKVTNRFNIVWLEEKTTIAYGIIKTSLKKSGQPIPENDIWIAAIAISNDYYLFTRDKHFIAIPGIKLFS